MKKFIKTCFATIGALAIAVTISSTANKLITSSNSFSTTGSPIVSNPIIIR